MRILFLATLVVAIFAGGDARGDAEITPSQPLFLRVWVLPQGNSATVSCIILCLPSKAIEGILPLQPLLVIAGKQRSTLSARIAPSEESRDDLMGMALRSDPKRANQIRAEFGEAGSTVYEISLDRALAQRASLYFLPKGRKKLAQVYLCRLKSYLDVP